jgi:hypothetical protein
VVHYPLPLVLALLSNLYPELRNEIYAHVVAGSTFHDMDRFETNTHILALTQTSQQLRNETYVLFAEHREVVELSQEAIAKINALVEEYGKRPPRAFGGLWA